MLIFFYKMKMLQVSLIKLCSRQDAVRNHDSAYNLHKRTSVHILYKSSATNKADSTYINRLQQM